MDELDIDKLVPVSVDLNKLSVHNAKIKNIEDKIPDITNLATKVFLNAKINEVKGGTHIITNLVTTAALTIVENKIPSVSDLVKKKKTDYDPKISGMENILLLLIIISSQTRYLTQR